MIKFMLKIVYLSLAMLHLYRCCSILVSQLVFNVKVKNLAFDTSKVITNGWVFYDELRYTRLKFIKHAKIKQNLRCNDNAYRVHLYIKVLRFFCNSSDKPNLLDFLMTLQIFCLQDISRPFPWRLPSWIC